MWESEETVKQRKISMRMIMYTSTSSMTSKTLTWWLVWGWCLIHIQLLYIVLGVEHSILAFCTLRPNGDCRPGTEIVCNLQRSAL
jgi:hypothetical protein